MATRLANSASKFTIADALLRQIAVKVQLSPTDYGIAVDHYDAVSEWLARDSSPIANVFGGLYAQGSMAIGATITSRLKNDEFDIDVIADLNVHRGVAPSDVLDALFDGMNSDRGSRYFGKVTRRSRCVTVDYDRMHLDITPAVRMPELADRTSTIFHANENESVLNHRHIVANPWGFAQWFKDKTPGVSGIVEAMLHKSAEPVPDQQHALEKSVSLIALQLLKRWRNKRYDNREGRSPPSVVLAFFVAHNAGQAGDLFSELRIQSDALHAAFAQAGREQRLVQVHNPECATDVLTDRWPGNLATQRVFLGDLEQLSTSLDRIEADPSVETCARVFADLFGESVTRVVMEDFQKNFSAGAARGGLVSGGGQGLALAVSGLSSAAAGAGDTISIPRHTDFGDED